MVTVKGKLTAREERQLAEARAHTEAVNRREREANFRGLAAAMQMTARTVAAEPARS